MKRFEDAGKQIPMLYAANTSKLVNIMNKLLELVTTTLKDEIDIEILEMHDQWKKDAPSGTSKEMGEIMAHALGKELSNIAVYGREGESPREPGTIGYQEEAEEQFEEVNLKLQKVGLNATFFSSLTNPCTRFVNNLVYMAVGIVGALSVIKGVGFTVGNLSCFLTYANQYTKPFNEISGVITELQSAFASAKRVFEVIDETEEIPDSSNATVLTSVDGTLDVDNVSFSYVPDVKLIENFNLHVKSGQRTAIVGPTGCGKTTMINLLMRFYDTDSGEIRISGEPIKDCTRDSMRSMYGMVLQETWLKTGTIRENLCYGKPDATEEEMIAAAKSAHCHGFIKRLPKGYDTVISDSYSTISAGQKQLLCIARVMLSLPPMLILDEATSSIDTRTEILVQRAFEKMMQGRTSFIIAHRLSTIKNADTIIVMDSGHIVEQGSHDELMAKNGFYADLYNSQFAVT